MKSSKGPNFAKEMKELVENRLEELKKPLLPAKKISEKRLGS
jgi:hypothetical protein